MKSWKYTYLLKLSSRMKMLWKQDIEVQEIIKI